ncbi:DUF2264 domain-containing protein [Anaerosporobacter faecicola]|uniref:DUF2264 domain-containing protein n=1 Tax=Anaerosporobacter faecicola TaxID=2718714 RepID=UPI00143ACCD3|nr:DUF2264 domain-containing protein [Anaerosporobacter faecicola]
MSFKPKTLDFGKSPYTGLTRESWIEAAEYLVEGIFQNIKDFNDPVIMPRQDTKITYPHLNQPKEIQAVEYQAEIFEGLARSLFVAAPLIHDDPKRKICGYDLREYYKNQILRCCTKGDANYVGDYESLQEGTGHKDPFRAFQQTVETCALVICLWESKEEIWDTYTKEEKDRIAIFLSDFAHANTVPQNWRLFNMLDLAFLHMEGYEVDKEIMLDHAQAILQYYAGDGWYRDGHSFDYYSAWAFNVYAPLWNIWYGYENEPFIAKQFEENSNKLMETYADYFDRDGFTNMWGRSNIYRNAATSAFGANLYLNNSKVDPGVARRVCSGSLLQFMTRDDFLYEGIPTLGFYGQFSPLVQGYSCAESPFWLGKAFLCLHLPAEHPFWTATEKNGTWDTLKPKEVKQTVLDGPALCFSNHEANGETILRTGKIVKTKEDKHGMWNYSKLSFNTKYPWEAEPVFTKEDGKLVSGELDSQQYVLKDTTSGEIQRANVTFWSGEKDDVLYRRQFFNYNLETECHWMQALNLADFTVPYGIMRVDKIRLFKRPISLSLGAYGFPDNGTKINVVEQGNAKAIILKGTDHTGKERQLAMTIYDGWSELNYVRSTGTNPDSQNSIIVYAYTERTKQYGGNEPYILISQVITKESHEDFTDDEIFPIKEVIYEDTNKVGAYGTTIITMKDGSSKKINYEQMEAKMML